MDLSTLQSKLSPIGQTNVLRFAEQLPEPGKQRLAGQLAALQLESLPSLIEENVRNKPHVALPKDIQPVQAYPYRPTEELKELESVPRFSS